MIDLVVFDLAGTTVQDGDAVNAAFRAALAGTGLDADPAAVNAVMGLPKPEAIRLLLAGMGRPVRAGDVDALHQDFVRRMRDHYAHDPSVREVPGAAGTFAALRQAGIRVALNTGFSRAITGVLLRRLGWHSLGRSVSCSSLYHPGNHELLGLGPRNSSTRQRSLRNYISQLWDRY